MRADADGGVARASRGRWWLAGYTLAEIMVAVAIIGTLAAMAMPMYWNYLEKARVAKAIAQIRSLEKAIDLYELETGALPHSLADVEWDAVVDPWNNPYVYLNLKDAKVPGGGGGGGGGGSAWNLFAPSAAYAAPGGGSPLKPRKDRFLVPINSDYDLYSVGKDGESVAPLTAAESRDDVVRANDGVFVGLATDF